MQISVAVCAYTIAQFISTTLCSAYTTKTLLQKVTRYACDYRSIKYHLFFPILLRAARQWLVWRDDVCSAVYRYYFCTNCTNTQCLLRRRTFASWVILIGCAKTDGPITGNITGSFCICVLANTAWPSYVVLHDRLAIKYNYTQN